MEAISNAQESLHASEAAAVVVEAEGMPSQQAAEQQDAGGSHGNDTDNKENKEQQDVKEGQEKMAEAPAESSTSGGWSTGQWCLCGCGCGRGGEARRSSRWKR
jgi:hypothetical protein